MLMLLVKCKIPMLNAFIAVIFRFEHGLVPILFFLLPPDYTHAQK